MRILGHQTHVKLRGSYRTNTVTRKTQKCSKIKDNWKTAFLE